MKRNTVILFILRCAKMAFSVVGLSLAAKYFGVSLDRDMWLIALNCIVVMNLAVWGPINETFRAKYVILREEQGEAQVLAKVRSLMVVALVISLFLVACILVFPVPLARLIAPAYNAEQIDALVLMLMIVAPSLLFDQFNQLGVSILNGHNSFFIPEISNCIAAVVNIVSMIVLTPYIGVYALAVSYYVGMALMVLFIVYEINKRTIPLFSWDNKIRLADFKPFFLYALPFFIPYFFIQVNVLVEKSLGNILGEGVVSMLDYSRRFVDIPINVLTSVLLTMLVPILAGHFAKRDAARFLNDFKQVYQFGLLIVTALIAFFYSSGVELLNLILYHDGGIPSTAIIKMASLSTYYAWSALTNFFYIIFGLALLATQKGKIYAFYGVIAQLIMIALNFMFYREFGAYTFPISFIVAHTFSAIALFVYFPYNRRKFVGVTLKYLCYLILVVFGADLLVRLIPWDFNTLGVLAVNGSVIVVLMFLLLFLFRFEERLTVYTQWKKVLKFVRPIRSNDGRA